MKKIFVIIIFLLAGGLGIFLWNENRKEEALQEQYDQRYEESLELNVQKRELQQRIEELEKEYAKSVRHVGTTQVLFPKADSRVYEVCYPIMESLDFTGVIALSPSQFPGKEGCVSLDQFKELMEAGWGICVAWEPEQELDAWLPAFRESLKEIGVEQGETMYFPVNVYNRELDESLQKNGFSIVVHHGENGETLIPTEISDGIWRLGAVGLMGEKPKRRLNEALEGQGNIAFTVGFELEDELYNERSFTSMLNYFDVYRGEEQLLVGDFRTTKDHYLGRTRIQITDENSEILKEKETLELELQRIEERLKKLAI